ncbi:hypothetical protein H9P43_001076 [Blastocladiella emersonii ATCC 22665]|nr:hypothetical protein H9P43_001076 [Blastocladiella emersonii ATCC 22665]
MTMNSLRISAHASAVSSAASSIADLAATDDYAWECLSVGSSAATDDAWDVLSLPATGASSLAPSDDEDEGDEDEDEDDGDDEPTSRSVHGDVLSDPTATAARSVSSLEPETDPAHALLPVSLAPTASDLGDAASSSPATATPTTALPPSRIPPPTAAMLADASPIPGVNRSLRRLHARCNGRCPLVAAGQPCAYCLAVARRALLAVPLPHHHPVLMQALDANGSSIPTTAGSGLGGFARTAPLPPKKPNGVASAAAAAVAARTGGLTGPMHRPRKLAAAISVRGGGAR